MVYFPSPCSREKRLLEQLLSVLEEVFGGEGGWLHVLLLEVGDKRVVCGVGSPDVDMSIDEVHLSSTQQKKRRLAASARMVLAAMRWCNGADCSPLSGPGRKRRARVAQR